MESILLQSEIRYRRLFEAAQDGILILDGNTGAIVDANPFLTENIGYSRDELLGKMLWQIGAIVDIDAAKEAFRKLESDGFVRYDNLQLRRKDGTLMDVEFISNAYDVAGQRVYQCNIRDITDRRKLEALTADNETHFRALVDNAADVIAICRLDGTITYISPAVRNVAGYEPQELIGKKFLEIVHPDDRNVATNMLSQSGCNPGKAIHSSLRVQRKGGDCAEIEGIARYLPDTPGILGVVANLHDVTISNQSRRDLVRSGHLLNESQRLGHIGSWFWAMADQVTWSDEMYRINGVQRDAFIPTVATLLGSIHADDRDKMRLWLAACAAAKKPAEIDFRIIRPDGTLRYINGRGEAVEDASAHVAYLAGTVQDITDRVLGAASLQQSMESTVQVLADIVESRDPYTAGHQRRVAAIAVAIARELRLPEDRVHGLSLAAFVHDIGKISVPAEILSKPSRLTPTEFQLVKGHVEAGFDVLKHVVFPWPLAEIVRQHHERLDGSGYPRGLKGDQILLESRILTVADVVEAIASHRPYRAGKGIDAALDEIARGRNTTLDADAVDACLRLFREQGFKIPERDDRSFAN